MFNSQKSFHEILKDKMNSNVLRNKNIDFIEDEEKYKPLFSEPNIFIDRNNNIQIKEPSIIDYEDYEDYEEEIAFNNSIAEDNIFYYDEAS